MDRTIDTIAENKMKARQKVELWDGIDVTDLIFCLQEAFNRLPKDQHIDPPTIYNRPIQEHGGGKYLRRVHPADGRGDPINIDIYCVIEAFAVACPGLQQALKKILACGQRGKGNKVDDIHGVFDAMWRALELQKQRESIP